MRGQGGAVAMQFSYSEYGCYNHLPAIFQLKNKTKLQLAEFTPSTSSHHNIKTVPDADYKQTQNWTLCKAKHVDTCEIYKTQLPGHEILNNWHPRHLTTTL